jgi:hypothetical protein
MWWKRSGEGELRRLVMESWDPIGVSGAPQAVDEYDDYLGPIAQRLREGASPEQIADYLATVRESMGLGPDEQADLHASERIAEWYPLSTNGFAKPSS